MGGEKGISYKSVTIFKRKHRKSTTNNNNNHAECRNKIKTHTRKQHSRVSFDDFYFLIINKYRRDRIGNNNVHPPVVHVLFTCDVHSVGFCTCGQGKPAAPPIVCFRFISFQQTSQPDQRVDIHINPPAKKKIRPKSGIWANKGTFGRYLGGEGQIWAVFGRKRVHLGLFWAENTWFKKKSA